MYLDVGLATRLRFDPTGDPFPYPDDAYPTIIIDARQAYGCTSAVEIENAWLDARDGDISWDPREVVPYINRGRWLADCPSCAVGFYVWDGLPSGCCLRCGRIFKVAWHPPKERSEAIRILAVRDRANQNWDAHKGETVARLEFENRWYLGEVTVEKNGVRMPSTLVLPELSSKDRIA